MVQNVAIPIASINIADAEIEVGTFKEIPLTALSSNTRRQLSGLLNSRKYLHSERGYYRDWRGIAALTQDRYFFDESAISGSDPTSRVLEEWCKFKPKDATFANLQKLLGLIDRWDASDDIYENLVEDARIFKAKKDRASSNLRNQQTSTAGQPSIVTPPADNDTDILTVDDKKLAEMGLQPQIYDAFVLYADIDAKYAAEIKKRLEEENNSNLKLCFKDNLLAGETFVHVALTQLIEERCNRLIVIFTKEFRKSPEDEFLVDYTHAVQIRNNVRKIIPLIYDEDVELPRTLKYVTHLKYNAINYWERLAASIRSISVTPEAISTPTLTLPENKNKNKNKLSISSSISVSSQPSPSLEIPSINVTLVPEENAVPAPVRSFKKHHTTHRSTSNYTKNISNGNVAHNNTNSNSNTNHHSSNTNHHSSNTNHQNQNHNNNNNSENNCSKFMNVKGLVLRHAHSTSQLNGKIYKEHNQSSSDISVTSNCSDSHKNKKKKKWPTKFLKRVFSRSSNKLHTAV